MTIVNRESLPALAPRPSRLIEVESLGGDVEVRGLLLNAKLQTLIKSNSNGGRVDIEQLLADCVYANDGELLWARDEWAAWGADNVADATHIATVALELSGLLQEDAEKKQPIPNDNS